MYNLNISSGLHCTISKFNELNLLCTVNNNNKNHIHSKLSLQLTLKLFIFTVLGFQKKMKQKILFLRSALFLSVFSMINSKKLISNSLQILQRKFRAENNQIFFLKNKNNNHNVTTALQTTFQLFNLLFHFVFGGNMTTTKIATRGQ